MRVVAGFLTLASLAGCTLGPSATVPVERTGCLAPPMPPAPDLVDRMTILAALESNAPPGLIAHRSVAGGDMGAAFSRPTESCSFTMTRVGVLVRTPTATGATLHLVRPAETTPAEDPFVAPDGFGWSEPVRMIAADVIEPPAAPIGTMIIARSAGGRGIEDALGRRIAEDGWRVVLTDRPTTAATSEIASRDLTPTAAGTLTAHVINGAIEDIACLILALDELDTPRPLVLAGMSQGAIQAPGAAAVAGSAVDGLIVALGGGSMDAVLQGSRYSGFSPRTLSLVRNDEYRAAFRDHIRLDPLDAAPCVQAEQVLMIRAAFDAAVPASTQTALWEALGRPPRWLHLGGHYGAFLNWRSTLLPALRHVTEFAEPTR